MTISSESALAVPPVESDAPPGADKDELIPRYIARPKHNCHDKQLQRSSVLQANVQYVDCTDAVHSLRWCFSGFAHPVVLRLAEIIALESYTKTSTAK